MSTHRQYPDRIGQFQILGLIGEGAMGRVFRAQQHSPRRRVALKLPRDGAAQQVFQRFQRETALLAALEHPHIARLYESGTAETEQGSTPYLAMELVEGQVLTLAVASWPLRRKLELLAKLARAVHYAHARGVVHRDLKPANVLVTDDGEPKILDFGVARARDEEGSSTQLTLAGEIVGTLAYMAWEQLAGSAAAADPRIDVYALGAIAYELLCGQRPYPDLPTHSLAAAVEMRRTQSPVALYRCLPAARGDLNTIVMKALERDPQVRYDSALALASDFERHLADLPIEARPPTAGYLLRKYVRRHRVLTAAATTVSLALVIAAVVSARFALSEQAARLHAEEQTAAFEATNRFLEDLLTAADPEKAQGQPMSVRQIIDRARVSLSQQQNLPPSARALAAAALSQTYTQLGDPRLGLSLLDEAEQRTAGQPINAFAAAKLRLTRGLVQTQLPDMAGAYATLQPLLTPEPPADKALARIWIDARATAANAQFALGHLDEAGRTMAGLGDLSTRLLGPNDASTFAARANEVTLLYQKGKLPEARTALDEMLPRMDASIGALHPYTLIMRQQQALVLRDQGEIDPAIAQMRKVTADRRTLFGPDHDFTLASERLLIQMLRAKDPASTEIYAMTREITGRLQQLYGLDHRATQQAFDDQARAAMALGRYDEAEDLYRQVLAAQARLNLGDDFETLARHQGQAELMLKRGQAAAAERRLRELHARSVKALGEDHPRSFVILSVLGEAAAAQGRFAEARQVLTRALELAVAKLGEGHNRSQAIRKTLDALPASP